MPVINVPNVASMTALVNRIDRPAGAMRQSIFRRSIVYRTETLEIGSYSRGRIVAPFTQAHGGSVMIGGPDRSFLTVENPPNMRLSVPIPAARFAYSRDPGVRVFPNDGEHLSNIAQQVQFEMNSLVDDTQNAEEYLATQVPTGVVTWTTKGGGVNTMTFDKPAANNIAVAFPWTDNTNSTPLLDVLTMKRQLSTTGRHTPNIAFVAPDVHDAMLGNDEIRTYLDNRRLVVGSMDTRRPIDADGIVRIGDIHGIEFFEYNRELTLDDGTVVPMIRPGTIEFMTDSVQAENVTYYAGIPAIIGNRATVVAQRRYSKVYSTPDPEVLIAILHSRPFPFARRPESFGSLTAVA